MEVSDKQMVHPHLPINPICSSCSKEIVDIEVAHVRAFESKGSTLDDTILPV